MIVMVMIILLQSFVELSAFAPNRNIIVYFPHKQEICLFDLENKTSKKLFEVKEKGYEIDFNTAKSLDGKIYFTIQNKDGARYSYIPGTNCDYQYQKGILFQKDYLIQINGRCELIKLREIVAINEETIEIRETDYLNKAKDNTKVIRRKNEEKVIKDGQRRTEIVEKNGIQLIVENRNLFIQRNGGGREVLINADKKVNYKIAYGCYNPSINNAGTKGLCSYYPWHRQKEEKEAILEIDLLDNRIIKHTEIYGFNPSFSPDDQLILYQSFNHNHYEVFNIQDKRITKLPESQYAVWVSWD